MIMTSGRLATAVAGLLCGVSASATPVADERCDLRFSGGVTLEAIPVARSIEQQARGLSHRVDAGPGLLFAWDHPGPRVFWMRETSFPLTVAFFDANGLLFAMADMAANSDDYHFSGRPALDALELAQGQFQVLGLSVGSRLLSRECYPANP